MSPTHAHPHHHHAHHREHLMHDTLHRIHHHQAKLAKHHARLASLLHAVETQIKTGQLDPSTARVAMLQLENYVELVELALDRVRQQGETILGLVSYTEEA